MKKRRNGALKSGRFGRKVKGRKQAIAIGLSEAQQEGSESAEEDEKRKAKRGGASTPPADASPPIGAPALLAVATASGGHATSLPYAGRMICPARFASMHPSN
jgi:hypothetical protein